MILRFLPFIITAIIVRSESLWTKLTSKPSLPNDLQELLESLYITGYIPEYILPEDELTETEKTEGEYLEFPDLKNAQNDVFVPPESEYSKNNAHYKNIKGHKRLIPEQSYDSKMPKTLEEIWSPFIGPEDLRLDFIAHLTENFTGKELGQNNSAKLDFLIPIPEKGTYAAEITPTLQYHIQPMGPALFHNPTTIASIYNLAFLTTTKNQTMFPQSQYFFTLKPPQPQTNTTTKTPYPYQVMQPKPVWPVKQTHPGLMEQQPQPFLYGKKAQLDWKEQKSLHPAHLEPTALQLLKTNQGPQEPFSISGIERLHGELSRRPHSKASDKRIESKAVSLVVDASNSAKQETIHNKNAIEANVPLDNEAASNIETKVVGQTNISSNNSGIENREVQVLESTPRMSDDVEHSKPKKKMFTFLNIFKKNKKQPPVEDHTRNSSIAIKEDSGASSLAELYNQLIDSNLINENNGMEKRYLSEHEANGEVISYHKRKK